MGCKCHMQVSHSCIANGKNNIYFKFFSHYFLHSDHTCTVRTGVDVILEIGSWKKGSKTPFMQSEC